MLIDKQTANLLKEGNYLIEKYGTTDYMTWALCDILRLYEIVNELHARGYPIRKNSD